MRLMARSCSPRRALARLVPVLVATSIGTAALAAPTDSSHRFERIGYSVGNVAAVVRVPNKPRAIVATRNGEIHRVAGDRLVDELMGTIAVSQTCDGDGVLGAAWDNQSNSALFVTYISPAPRKFTVARYEVTGAKIGPPTILFAFPVPGTTGCTNLGGGIAQASDGRLIVGVGDMGNGPGAGQQSVMSGKILRLNAVAPGGAASDNPNPSSPVYGLGVRNPTRLVMDPLGSNGWFVDLGPGTNDELNWISGGSVNYAWPRATGNFDTAGFRDPAHIWTTPVTPTGIMVNTGANFGPQWASDVVVTAANGTIYRTHPTDLLATPPAATTTTIFTPGTGEPNAFADAWMPADGYAYVATPNGEMFRLRSDRGPVQEPSDRESIVPMLVRKLSGGALEIVAERETALEKYGYYPGTTSDFYTHDAPSLLTPDCDPGLTTGATEGCLYGDSNLTSAWSRIQLNPTQVDAMSDTAYFMLSALNSRAETAVGTASSGAVVPGGIQTFGCPCPAGEPEGYRPGECMVPFTLARGIWSEAGGEINNVTVDTDFDCNVILIDLSEDWCFWCHELAPELETIYTDYKDRGFTLITLISQDAAGNYATFSTIQGWVARHGSTNPVLLDENERVMTPYFNVPDCGGWPQSLLFDRDGMQVENICGYDPAGIRAAVDREVNR